MKITLTTPTICLGIALVSSGLHAQNAAAPGAPAAATEPAGRAGPDEC